VEDGLWALGSLAARGVGVLNRAGALLAAHDKLLTAKVLQRAGLPHPRTRILHPGGQVPDWEGPLVVKPRFGSWGRDVELCEDEIAFRRHLRSLEHRLWFQRHGAVLQQLVTPSGFDLRIVVAAGTAVGAISRVAAPGEWRTNIALGGTRAAVEPSPEAIELAVRAADAAGADLIGVDLLPDGAGGHTVLELNGAVDFTREYGIDRDPFVAAAAELTRAALAVTPGGEPDELAAAGSEGAL
jgi:RimK family alpha-L-glutamate ligase